MKLSRNSTIGFIVIVIILLMFVSFLLTTNYTSQTSLQQNLLDQFLQENNWRASAVSYFFNDRREDMLNLASSREIEVFYENRALGMSMEYGLKQSLPPIKERFISLLKRHPINQDAVYLQIALLDDKGLSLVEAQSFDQLTAVFGDARKLLNPEHRTGVVLSDDNSRAIIISTAYYFKGKYSGQILAWINPAYITSHIMIPQNSHDRKSMLVAKSGSVYLPIGAELAVDAKGHPEGEPFRFDDSGPGIPPQHMIGLNIPIKNTPFLLMIVAPARSVLGNIDPRGLLITMGLLAIAIIGSAIYLERTLRRSMVLEAGLNASRKHEQEQQEKNLQLEKEIAERKQAEEALKESREQLRTVVEKSPFSMALVNMRGDIEYINLKAIETFGYLPQDIPNMDRWWEQAYPDKTYRDQVITQWMGLVNEALLNKHEIEKREYRVICKDGAVKIVTIFGVWVGDKVLTVFDDITERKMAEEKIRQSELFIRNILDTVDEGFIVIDREYRIQTANRAYYEHLPIPCSNIIGENCFAVSHGKIRPCYEEGEECAVRQVFEDGKPHSVLHKHAGPDNAALFLETRAFPLNDSSGNITSAIAVITNITEKHLLEEERLKTQKLEAVGTLAGGIAHDFNNLLQGVFGYISLAKIRSEGQENTQEALKEAEKALHMSVQLTNQLLTFSKGGKPVKKTLDPLTVIENAAKFALSGSRSNYRFTTDNGVWKIDADEGQISQVIQNIVLNADQAMPDAGTIEITAKNVQIPGLDLPQTLTYGKYVEITITDNGIGIPEKYLRRIFDPYFTTKEKGSGLGLATSYSIIKNHGGEIDVKSELGKGTSFHIYLPAAVARANDKQPAPVSAISGRKGRILVMDDEDFILKIARELIKTIGHEIETAKNGTEALTKYQEALRSGKPFDIAILDLTIRGGMGGAETLKKLLEIDPMAMAVVSSGYSDDSAIASYKYQGFKAILKKPYTVDELQDVLNRLLNT